MQGAILDVYHYPLDSHSLLGCETQLLPKSAESKGKTSFPLRKHLNAILCSFFSLEMPSKSDKTATTAASTLISVAAATLAIASASSSPFGVFKNLLAAFPSGLGHSWKDADWLCNT